MSGKRRFETAPLADAPPELGVHLVMHNYGTHKTSSIKAWFATLTEKYIRRGAHRPARQLEQSIRQYLDIHNANPKRFVWTKSADDIFAGIEMVYLRASNSRH